MGPLMEIIHPLPALDDYGLDGAPFWKERRFVALAARTLLRTCPIRLAPVCCCVVQTNW